MPPLGVVVVIPLGGFGLCLFPPVGFVVVEQQKQCSFLISPGGILTSHRWDGCQNPTGGEKLSLQEHIYCYIFIFDRSRWGSIPT